MTFLLLAALLAGPESFAVIAKNAEAARTANRMDEAVKLYQQGLQLNPKWAEGAFYLGTIYYDRDQFADGRELFGRSAAANPKNAAAWAFLGLCEYKVSEYAKALQHLLQARDLGLGLEGELSKVARYHSAILLSKYERFEAALDILSEFAKRNQDSPGLLEAAGIAGLRFAVLPEELPVEKKPLVIQVGRAMFDSGARRRAEAQKEFEQILAAYPDTPNVHYLYGSFLLGDNGEAAVRELQREMEISPQHVPARLQLAFEYLKRGEPQKGIAYAEEAAKLAPENFVAWNALGRLQTAAEQYTEAVKSLERAAKLAPENAETRFALATAYAKAGRMQDAAKERVEFLRLKELRGKTGEQ